MRASRVLRTAGRWAKFASETPKATTGITGLLVDSNWRQTLTSLYDKTLADAQVMPEDVEYRKAVEAITKYRQSLVDTLPVSFFLFLGFHLAECVLLCCEESRTDTPLPADAHVRLFFPPPIRSAMKSKRSLEFK
jgi:hypothetical protein